MRVRGGRDAVFTFAAPDLVRVPLNPVPDPVAPPTAGYFPVPCAAVPGVLDADHPLGLLLALAAPLAATAACAILSPLDTVPSTLLLLR